MLFSIEAVPKLYIFVAQPEVTQLCRFYLTGALVYEIIVRMSLNY
jgi:hypothetical protein